MTNPNDQHNGGNPGGSSAGAGRADPQSLLSIIDSAMDAIITVNADHRIILFNRAAERVFGVRATEVIGTPVEKFVPFRFRDRHGEFIRSFGAAGTSIRTMGRLGTIFGLRADGREFPMEASISHSMHEGRQLFTVILRDVTESVEREAQLLQAQKMESVGRLAGGVAHDFNNLLMAMTNYLELAQRRLSAEHPSRAYLDHVREAADRAAGLTTRLLAFARKQVIHPRVVCPREVVENLESMLRRMIGEDVLLYTSLAADTGNVLADVPQLEQVLMNLAVNARDAMPTGGKLTVETRNVRVDDASRIAELTPGDYVELLVSDTGAGMTPEVRARVFEPFFTTKAPGMGTGLGLAMCHGIVNQHGGLIRVFSELNRGTQISVLLPRVVGSTDSAAKSPLVQPPKGGNETVLVAEDSDVVRELTVIALKEAGYHVLSARDGVSALAEAERHGGQIHLVLTDMVMPGMGGMELVRSVLVRRPSAKVLIMSGYTEESMSDAGLALDGKNFLSKPFMTDAMLERVRELLDQPAEG